MCVLSFSRMKRHYPPNKMFEKTHILKTRAGPLFPCTGFRFYRGPWRQQLWDRDLFKYNDHIAEGQLDLGPYFHRAYKMRDTVKLFPKMDPKLEKKRDELRTEVRACCISWRILHCERCCCSCFCCRCGDCRSSDVARSLLH